MLLPANACVIILRCGRPVSRPFTKIIAKDYMDDIDYILWFTSMIWTLYHNICRMRRSGSSSNPPSPTRNARHRLVSRVSAFGYLGRWIRKAALGDSPVDCRNRRGFSAEKRIPLSPPIRCPRRDGGIFLDI